MKKRIFALLLFNAIILATGCSNTKNDYDVLEGIWIAIPENQKIHQTVTNNETVGGKEDYFLECDGKGNYALKTKSEDLANASYTISDNIVTFYDEGRQILGICKLNNNELDCNEKSYYAFKYTKIEN